jgi:hypothetical protein
MVNDPSGVVLDRLRVDFDDERAVANAGLLLPATLAALALTPSAAFFALDFDAKLSPELAVVCPLELTSFQRY